MISSGIVCPAWSKMQRLHRQKSKARILLLVNLPAFFSDFGLGMKKKRKKNNSENGHSQSFFQTFF